MEQNYMELYTKLSRLQWLLQRHHMQTHTEHGPTGDPTRGQGRVLAALRLQPEIATKDLSYLLGIRQQSLNELLNKLEKNGYVVREPSETDRRIMLVKLTEKGQEAERPPQVHFADIFSCLSQEEQAKFGEYLDRVIAALEKQLTAEEWENIEEWMNAARSRMGNEQFERLMASWGGDRHFHRDPQFRPGCPSGPHPHHRHGFGGFWKDREDAHEPMRENMPGAERFDPENDGPIPHRQEPHPFGSDGQAPPSPPPPPSNIPHDPDEE